MKIYDKCAECGELEADHGHQFVAANIPDGCECNPNDWVESWNIPEVCSNGIFVGASPDGLCDYCNHPEECHPYENA